MTGRSVSGAKLGRETGIGKITEIQTQRHGTLTEFLSNGSFFFPPSSPATTYLPSRPRPRPCHVESGANVTPSPFSRTGHLCRCRNDGVCYRALWHMFHVQLHSRGDATARCVSALLGHSGCPRSEPKVTTCMNPTSSVQAK